MHRGKRSRKTNAYSAPALEKGLDILELLAGAQRGSSLSEVAVALGRTRNEIFRMLSCLEDRGYIARKNGDDRFQLTARMFELAHRHPPTQDLVTVAMPVMRELAARSHQSCQVGMQHEGHVLIVAQVDAPGLVGVAMRVGARRELTNSASGLSLLAFQETRTRTEWLDSAGASRWPAAKKRALEKQLERIVRDRYVEHPNPAVKGVLGISSPICNFRGHAMATLTVTFAQLTAPHPSLREVRPWLIASAARITREMGGVPPTSTARRNSRARSRSR
jgi:DNA-binding IclR family transcriptional regulator